MPSMEFTEDAEQQLTSTIIAYGLPRWHCGKNKKVDAAMDYLSLKDFPLIASTLSRLLDTVKVAGYKGKSHLDDLSGTSGVFSTAT